MNCLCIKLLCWQKLSTGDDHFVVCRLCSMSSVFLPVKTLVLLVHAEGPAGDTSIPLRWDCNAHGSMGDRSWSCLVSSLKSRVANDPWTTLDTCSGQEQSFEQCPCPWIVHGVSSNERLLLQCFIVFLFNASFLCYLNKVLDIHIKLPDNTVNTLWMFLLDVEGVLDGLMYISNPVPCLHLV